MSTATTRPLFRRVLTAGAVFVALTLPLHAQTDVTTPREALGFSIGDDYHLATYQQFEAYWRTLASESPRMVLEEIGRTAFGRPQLMAIVTSPENHRNLDRYREISRRLALAEGVSEDEARRLAADGKAVVWIDGGLHATEVLGAHQLMDLVYQLVSRTDGETMRFLDDVIVLAAHANPDGMDLVSNWYMRAEDPEERSTSNIPILYQKYTGHDNNRDFYMITQPETENMTRIQYRVWFPQIIYNHHQTGPAGTVMFAPPFRDPFNYNFDPLIPLSIEAVGTAMHSRFVLEGKPGTTMRSGASYSTWWNGGLRTTPYFHNMIGLLTETIGHPTPMRIPLMLDRQLPQNDIPYPIPPQEWHFRQSIEYSLTANYGVLNYASRFREELLFNIWRMGTNAIEKGNRDTWRTDPTVIQAAEVAARQAESDQAEGGGGRFRRGTPPEVFEQVFRAPERRDPRGYILPSDQTDFPTAVKFMNTLIKGGVAVHRATRDFTVLGKQYPAGSFVVKTGQAFRAHVLDMFEPQHHPNDFAYPGGPPISPYDNTGWTVAFQMGVEFDRVLEGFDGPFDKVEGFAQVPSGQVANARGASGYLLSHAVNDVFVATNRLLADGRDVYWLTEPFVTNGRTWPAGTVYLPAASVDRVTADRLARELGIDFHAATATPGNAMRMSEVRVGLWDEYGGSMASGWARWILEQFEFSHRLVFPQELDAGNLRASFDAIVLVNGAVGSGGGFGGGGPEPEEIPAEYRDRLGEITVERTVPQLEAFLREGGTIITIGGSTALGRHLGLPLENYLVDYEQRPLTRDDYFVPGSILRVRVDNTRPIAWGMPEHVDVHFNNSPVFHRPPDNSAVRTVAWFDEREPLRSGWAWGQHYLMGGVTMAEATVGRGTLYLLGPEVIRRGQPHGTFKFLFNGIYLAGSEAVEMETASGSR